MKVTLPTSKLKEFLNLSKFIETEESDLDNLQILKYLKFEIVFDKCTVTKTSLRSFFQFSFDVKHEDCEFIVLESKISDWCSLTTQEKTTITIKQVESKTGITHNVVLSDGYYKPKHDGGKYEVKDFFKIANYGQSTKRIPKEVLLALDSAKIYTGTDDLRPMFKFVYLDDNYVYSSTMQTFFLKKFEIELPKISLSKLECVILATFPYVEFRTDSEGKSFNVFSFENSVYGFRQEEDARGFAFQSFLPLLEKKQCFKFKTDDFINFCNSTKIVSKSKKPVYINSKAFVTENKLKLSYIDTERGIENEIEVECVLNGDEFDFIFDHNQLLEIFKSLPYNDICISNEDHPESNFYALSLFNEQDKSYTGLVTKFTQ